MQIDPDGCTFWYTNQYYSANYVGWRTRIAAFRFSECGIAAMSPVGGVVEPVNRLTVFAPYLALFGIVAAVMVVVWKKRET